VRDAKDLQEDDNDNEFLTSVRKEMGQFYKRNVHSQGATTNLLANITTWWEDRADRNRQLWRNLYIFQASSLGKLCC